MNTVTLTNKIIIMAKESGADLIGIADPKELSGQEYQGNSPLEISEQFQSIILIGVMIPKGAFMPLPKGRALYTNTLMAVLLPSRIISYKIARKLEEENFLASIAPSEGSEFGYWYADKKTLKADFSMKYAAFCAGLGSFGKNHLFISEKYGSRVRFMAIVTDALLEHGTRSATFLHSSCKNCALVSMHVQHMQFMRTAQFPVHHVLSICFKRLVVSGVGCAYVPVRYPVRIRFFD